MTAIIHLADVVTDYLILCQFILLALDEISGTEYDHINYVYVSLLSIFTIMINKTISSYHIYKFSKSIWDVILNIFDCYIFKEIVASHESGNKTDLMQFLQVTPSVVFFVFVVCYCF